MTRSRESTETAAGVVQPAGDAERIYVAVGDVVADKYRVERVIGEGGMAFVVRARHLQLDEAVALKFLKRERLAEPEVVERFARESRAACRIKNEHVATVYDVGRAGGVPYLIIQYLGLR